MLCSIIVVFELMLFVTPSLPPLYAFSLFIFTDTVQARFIQSPRNQTVLEDESATLECTITSNHIMTSDEISTVTTYLFKVGSSFVDTVVYLPYFARDVYPSVQYQINNGPADVRCQGQITIATLGTFSAISDTGTLTPNGENIPQY